MDFLCFISCVEYQVHSFILNKYWNEVTANEVQMIPTTNCLPAGSVKVWDPRQKNDPVATMEPGEGETKRDCWAVAFGRCPFSMILNILQMLNCQIYIFLYNVKIISCTKICIRHNQTH